MVEDVGEEAAPSARPSDNRICPVVDHGRWRGRPGWLKMALRRAGDVRGRSLELDVTGDPSHVCRDFRFAIRSAKGILPEEGTPRELRKNRLESPDSLGRGIRDCVPQPPPWPRR